MLLRTFYAIFAGMCALLALGCAGLWVRSYSHFDSFDRLDSSLVSLSSNWGQLTLYTCPIDPRIDHLDPRLPSAYAWRYESPFQASPDLLYGIDTSPNVVWSWSMGRFLARKEARGVNMTAPTFITTLAVPHWFVCLLLTLPVLKWPITGWCRRRRLTCRRREGRCLLCGYDLRAHSPGQKCPECGTLIPEPPPGAPPRKSFTDP